jgi:hypothetical protein
MLNQAKLSRRIFGQPTRLGNFLSTSGHDNKAVDIGFLRLAIAPKLLQIRA